MESPETSLFSCSSSTVATLEHAAAICSSLSEGGLLDEETTTGTILGAFAASYPLMAIADGSPPMRWHRFTKAPAADKDSEAANGADFALAILGETGSARLAIFQAKRSAISQVQSGWRLDVRHVVKDVYKKDSAQMVALESLGLALMTINAADREERSGKKPTANDLSWIHYLLYGPGTPLCIPLSSMTANLPAEHALSGSSNFFSFKPDDLPTFGEILADVSTQPTQKWLTIKTEGLFGHLPTWINLVPLMVGGTEKAWTFLPKNRQSLLPKSKEKSWRKEPIPNSAKSELVTGAKSVFS